MTPEERTERLRVAAQKTRHAYEALCIYHRDHPVKTFLGFPESRRLYEEHNRLCREYFDLLS